MAETSRNYWKVPRFMNLSRFPVTQAKSDNILHIINWTWIQAKWLSIPHLLRNQTPQSPVGAHVGVPGVQAITARPQDMTVKIPRIPEIIDWILVKLLVKSREHTSKQIPVKIVQIYWLTWSTGIWAKWHFSTRNIHKSYTQSLLVWSTVQ